MEQVPTETNVTRPDEAVVQTDEVVVEYGLVPVPPDAVALLVGPVVPNEYEDENELGLIVRSLAVYIGGDLTDMPYVGEVVRVEPLNV
jgi:hypothetical protein